MFKRFKTFLHKLLGQVIEDQQYIAVDKKEVATYSSLIACGIALNVVGIYIDNLMGW